MKLIIGYGANNGSIKMITLVDNQGNPVQEAIDGNSAASILSGDYPLMFSHIDAPPAANDNGEAAAKNLFATIQKGSKLMFV